MKNEKKSAEPTKAVAEVESKSVVVQDTKQSFKGLIPSDIVIPKVLLMQGLSEFVAQRKAQLGDIVRSTTAQKLGDPEHPIEFIPLSFPESFWVNELLVNGKYKFKSMVPRTAANSGLPWNYKADANGNEVPENTPNAIQARRVQRLALYALLPGDIDADLIEKKRAEEGEFPDFSKALMPVLIAYRSLSFKAGKEVVSFFTQAAAFKQPAWKAILTLKCHMEQNEKGTFYIYDVDRSHPKPVKKEHLPVVEYWAGVVSSTQLNVDEAYDEDAASGTQGAGQF